MRLASRFGYAANQIRRDRPLTHEELIRHVPSIFGEDRHTSRSERYAYIPTITVLENLQKLFCSTLMTVPPATRCCRVTSGSSARTGASVASLWGKCVFHTGEM